MRQHVHANRAGWSRNANGAEQGKSYARCRELIADPIGRRAAEKALAVCLDERFSVSNRQRAGLLQRSAGNA